MVQGSRTCVATGGESDDRRVIGGVRERYVGLDSLLHYGALIERIDARAELGAPGPIGVETLLH